MLLLRARYSKFCPKTYINEIKNQFIEIPKLTSSYNDKVLSRYIKRVLPSQYFNDINEDLKSFSHKMENEYYHLHKNCENNPPKLEKYDGWGKLVDRLVTCNDWKVLKSISSEEGIVAIPYERNYNEYSRIYQGVKLILFSALSGLYSCPLAMTDGAAFVLQGLDKTTVTQNAFDNLTSRNPTQFWTSGQWMTEKKGGSDVANSTDTVAIWDPASKCHRLYGYKWFTSATDANMALTLARSVDGHGEIVSGGAGLSLYYVETASKDDGSINDWNHLEIVALKDKLGTRQLPTSELILNGTKAIKLSEDGRGISAIAGMLTITRIHNSIAAVSGMRRIVLLATEYAKHRKCFGTSIIDKPLHASTLASLDIESRAAFYFVMDVLRLLGLQENHLSTKEDDTMLRILSPLLKLYTAKQAMYVIPEALECFGGQGYIETTGLPGMLRDAQVLPIWEGTTNILSLDVLRSLKITTSFVNEISQLFIRRCNDKLKKCDGKKYAEEMQTLKHALGILDAFLTNHNMNMDILQLHSRHLALVMSRIYIGTLLLEQASAADSDLSDHLSILYWVKKDLFFGLDRVGASISPDEWKQFFQ